MSNAFSAWNDTIVALATPPGVGAIGVIRLSGEKSVAIADELFPSKNLSRQASHTLHVGMLKNENEELDEVVVALFKTPKSYTGENVVEISCHGSPFIQQQIIAACIQKGARLAMPGEFTQRAFLNGKMDLTQAEAVADVIAAHSSAAQQAALKQLRGGFSSDLKILREELIGFAALIELELDFSQEDVEFADRTQLQELIARLTRSTQELINSFSLGNVIKNGVNVAIIGRPNAGKSTLLNALLNEERAIVSEIAGTTRDTIEETLNINGIIFRFNDTAGIREHTTDTIEQIGIQKTFEKIDQSAILLYLADLKNEDPETVFNMVLELSKNRTTHPILVFNKADLMEGFTEFNRWTDLQKKFAEKMPVLLLSAKNTVKGLQTIDDLKQALYHLVVDEKMDTENTIVTNARHYAALQKVAECLGDIETGMQNNLPGDLLALDIRRCLHYLGEITGQVETDRDILGTIFGKFCVGK